MMVTHTTQSLDLCDKVIFMGQGGRVCFMGNVDEARAFFRTDDLTEIYNMMARNTGYWANRYAQTLKGNAGGRGKGSTEQFRRPRVPALKQFSTITARYVELLINDRRKTLILLLEPILIGLLLYIVAENTVFDLYGATKSIMFVLSCAAIWIGLFNSIQEICKERSILQREYMANLRLPVYILSKVIVQAVLGLIQAILMTVTFLGLLDLFKDEGNVEVEAKDILLPGGLYVEIIVAVWITIIASMALGLLISSIVRTGDKAMTMAPFILIVQLLFSGILFKLKGVGTVISYFTISRWSVDSLGRLVNLRELDYTENTADVPDDVDEGMFDWDPNWILGEWGILIGMALITIILSVVILRNVAKDGRYGTVIMTMNNKDRWVELNRISIPPRGNGGFEADILEREIWAVSRSPEVTELQETELLQTDPEQTELQKDEPLGAYLLRMKTDEKIPLGDDSLTIGSGTGADYIIEDNEGIERVHAQISPINGMYYITDMGTNAGTFIDGVPLTSTKKLEGNIVIRLADEDFIFKSR